MRRIVLIVALLLLSAAASRLCAQQQPLTPRHKLAISPLDDALTHLDANIEEFYQTIPAFYAREELTAVVDPGPDKINSLHTSTSSTFIVRRAGDPADPDDPANDTNNPTQPNQLHESRVVRFIDDNTHIVPDKDKLKDKSQKKTDTGVRLDTSYAVFGLYSGASSRISTAAKTCFRYRYHPARNIHGASRIVIDFQSWPRKDRGANCPYAENISGHGFIDAATMRLVRVEDTETDDKGTWTWSVDYASVPLNGKPFWLPVTIRSEDVQVIETGKSEVRNIHRLIATYTQYRQGQPPPADLQRQNIPEPGLGGGIDRHPRTPHIPQ